MVVLSSSTPRWSYAVRFSGQRLAYLLAQSFRRSQSESSPSSAFNLRQLLLKAAPSSTRRVLGVDLLRKRTGIFTNINCATSLISFKDWSDYNGGQFHESNV